MRARPLFAGLLLVASATLPNSATAQGLSSPWVTAGVGPSGYDLAGTGTAWAGSLRLSGRIGGPLRAGATVGYFGYETQGGSDISMVLPEAALYLGRWDQRWAPYVGAGGGAAFVVSGPGETELTVHGSVGLDRRLDHRWSVGAEGRVRALDPWAGSQADLVITATRRFGS